MRLLPHLILHVLQRWCKTTTHPTWFCNLLPPDRHWCLVMTRDATPGLEDTNNLVDLLAGGAVKLQIICLSSFIRFKIKEHAASLVNQITFLDGAYSIYVTRSDKIGLIAEKYTCS